MHILPDTQHSAGTKELLDKPAVNELAGDGMVEEWVGGQWRLTAGMGSTDAYNLMNLKHLCSLADPREGTINFSATLGAKKGKEG